VSRSAHPERHRSERIGWLRAAVLGANDRIVSTANLVLGVVAASAATGTVLMTGMAGLVAGAMSMAVAVIGLTALGSKRWAGTRLLTCGIQGAGGFLAKQLSCRSGHVSLGAGEISAGICQPAG
jgi:hypothetical protein